MHVPRIIIVSALLVAGCASPPATPVAPAPPVVPRARLEPIVVPPLPADPAARRALPAAKGLRGSDFGCEPPPHGHRLPDDGISRTVGLALYLDDTGHPREAVVLDSSGQPDVDERTAACVHHLRFDPPSAGAGWYRMKWTWQ